jgi:hypothetical protein
LTKHSDESGCKKHNDELTPAPMLIDIANGGNDAQLKTEHYIDGA